MIRALLRFGDRQGILLGLSHENVARLFADEPIEIDLSAPPPRGLGIEGGPIVVLIAGSTEEAMAERVRAAFGPPANESHEGDGS